jgi:CpeT protein
LDFFVPSIGIYPLKAMKFILLLCTLSFTLPSYAQTLKVKAKDLKTLQGYMAGEFNNAEQAATDITFFNIYLRMTPIMKDHPDGYWLYVEQATAESQDKPYRQRVYHLIQANDTTLMSKVFEIKNPKQYVGGWKDEKKLAVITVDSLTNREGCDMYISKVDKEIFRATTMGTQCTSVLRGASYATSQVVIYPDRLVSWDRGWDKNDVQVWGSVNGAYAFIKTKK